MRRGIKVAAIVAAAGIAAGALLIGLPRMGSGVSRAVETKDSRPAAGSFPVTIPVSSSPPTAQCPGGYVALTFVDGPTRLTSALLATLRNAGVKATFFDVGTNVLQFSAQVKQESNQGWVGNHSFIHPNLVTLGEPQAFNELLGTNQEIKKITGQAPTLFLPPSAELNYRVDFDARELGMTSVLWTTDSYDYTGVSTAQIEANAEKVRPGGIILFHDGYQNTINALPGIVNNLASRGLCAGKIVHAANPIITSSDQTVYATVVHW